MLSTLKEGFTITPIFKDESYDDDITFIGIDGNNSAIINFSYDTFDSESPDRRAHISQEAVIVLFNALLGNGLYRELK